jgi:lysophospholipase L1-like esterase
MFTRDGPPSREPLRRGLAKASATAEILRCGMSKVNAFSWVVLGVMIVTALHAQEGSQPVPRSDENSRIAHKQLLDKARRGGIDVYFEGDSITRRWGTSDAAYRSFFEHWTKSFFGWNAANFGWGADTVQNILWRLTNGELDEVHPKVIVIMAGTNNVGGMPRDGVDTAVVEYVANGMRAVLDLIRSKAPDATVILMGITPRTDSLGGASVMPTIDAINERYARLADGAARSRGLTRYLTINRDLARADGTPRDGVTVDGLHLSLIGYQVWADALKPIFTEILGPPATTDHAPPPTGDPAAR